MSTPYMGLIICNNCGKKFVDYYWADEVNNIAECQCPFCENMVGITNDNQTVIKEIKCQ